MKFILKKPAKENIYTAIRKIGYYFLSKNKEEINCVRSLGTTGYPRFHIYLQTEGEDMIFNLHLDQKKPIYKGTAAHSGEYKGETVQKEADRIKQILL